MTVEERIIQQLDRDQPDWWKDWATRQDLRDLATNAASPKAVKGFIYNRMIWRVLNAAISCGIVLANE